MRLVFQSNPGVRTGEDLLLAKHHSVQVDCHDGEVCFILLFSFGGVCPLPMVAVHGLENPPFRIARKLLRNSRAIEALIHRRDCSLSCKVVGNAVSSQRSIGKPVAHHDPVVAESKLIEPVNDYLCASRHNVGRFDLNHNCVGVKLNILADGVSISMFSTQSGVNKMSECMSDDNAKMMAETGSKLVVAKCQHTSIFGSPKMLQNKASNHVSNHDRAFVICVTSNSYKGVFNSANHASNHDGAKIAPILAQVTTQVTTGDSLVICVIPITYSDEIFRGNHVSNHDRLKNGGSKMKVTTQVTTIAPPVISDLSIGYVGSKMSANHASNHGATPKLPPKKTYSIYKIYINILIIILLYWESKRARARMYAHARGYDFEPVKKNDICQKLF